MRRFESVFVTALCAVFEVAFFWVGVWNAFDRIRSIVVKHWLYREFVRVVLWCSITVGVWLSRTMDVLAERA